MVLVTVKPRTQRASAAIQNSYKENTTISKRLKLLSFGVRLALDGENLKITFKNAYNLHPKGHFLNYVHGFMTEEKVPIGEYITEVVYNA